MIKNQRQYRITKARAREFAEVVSGLETTAPEDVGIHPLLFQARRDAAQSQHDELVEQLQAYEALTEGRTPVLELESLDQLPQALIKARISAGLSQSDLATRLGLKPQQVQRYEATGYSAASLERIQEVTEALGMSVREEVLLPNERFKLRDLWSTTTDLGFTKAIVLRRLLPRALRDRVAQVEGGEAGAGDEAAVVSQAAAFVARAFGLSASALLGPRRPALSLAPVYAARFRVRKSAQEEQFSAYTAYAHVLALLTLETTRHLEPLVVPEDPRAVRAAILERHGEVSFKSALEYVWSLGIPVLPLNDPAAFQAACWRVEGRNVIVLKQQTLSSARWLYDLLHELRHAAEAPDEEERTVVEESPTSQARLDDPEEERADDYSEDIVFGGRADELAQLCVARGGGRVDRLKKVVVEVAHEQNVDLGALANYLAHRLSEENNIDWWGTAHNIQKGDAPAWALARDVFLTNVRLSGLNEFDRNLLLRAFEENELEEETEA